MTLRFRRSLKIESGRGINVDNHGVHGNVGLPGTQASFLNKEDNPAWIQAKDPSHANSGKESMEVELELDDLGGIKITDKTGNELTPKLARTLHTQYDSNFKTWLEEQAEQINQKLDSLLGIHNDTPDPDTEIVFQEQTFDPPILNMPKLKLLGLRGRLFKSRRLRIEQENMALIQKHNQGFKEMDKAWLANDREQERLRQLIEIRRLQDVDGMSDFLELRLKNLKWPRKTNVNFSIATLSELCIDVDFPAIEEMPTRQAVVAKRGYKLNIKDVSVTQNRRNYAYHIHSMGFRIIGECFYALPTLKRVTFSGYSRTKNKASEDLGDQYLYSVVVERNRWRKIKFNNLHDIDVLQIFNQFDLRRTVTKTLVFKPIEPFGPIAKQNFIGSISGIYSD